MELAERRDILIIGDSGVASKPFIERRVKLVPTTILGAPALFNQARAIIVSDFEGKFSLIRECFRGVFPQAEDYGLLPIILVYSLNDYTQVSALRDKDYPESAARIYNHNDIADAAEEVARHVAGPPAEKISIEPLGILSESQDQLLVQRAFADCTRIYLEQLYGGKASIGVYRTHAWLKQSQVGPRPLPFFLKIGDPTTINREEQNYHLYADHYIPFNLRPNLDRSRCVKTRGRAALVGSFVDDAILLRKSLRAGDGAGLIFSLFESTLRGFRLQPFYNGDSKRSDVLRNFANDRIWIDKLPESVVEKAQSLGLDVSAEDLRKQICNVAEPLSCWVAPCHGDLHSGNIMVRGGDAIIIDFGSTDIMPLTADPAALEVSLMFGTDSDEGADSFDEWRRAIDDMYEGPISNLHPPFFHDPKPGRFSWLGRTLRELRHVLLGCGCECAEANVVLASYLMRFARLPLEDLQNKDLVPLASARHAYALVVAKRLMTEEAPR